MKAPILPVRNKGFALIVTLSLMILLTVIAVGLLSLSSISLRAAGQGEAMATAKANARLALMLAIGDLQKTLGPDRAVTATSEILGAAPTKPNLTGVWESWFDFDPNSSPAPDYVAQKTNRFRRWLVSSTDPAGPTARNFATTSWTGNTVELVGAGSLGTAAPASAKVTAGLVPVSKGGKIQSSYAWHVADESVKARINTYRDPSQNTTLAQKRALLAGHRPDASVMTGTDGTKLDFLPTDTTDTDFAKAQALSGKLLDLNQVGFLSATPDKAKQFRNDVTPYSLGVMADVRNGGLKQDLSSIFEMSTASGINLPAEFSGTGVNAKKLYKTSLGDALTGVSDPYWTNLAGYYNIFRNIATPDSTPTLDLPPVTNSLTTDLTPKTYFPGPVISKVEMLFSLVTREIGSTHLGNNPVTAKYDDTVNLICTPQISLHNPYNVSISFYQMDITVTDVPVAFRFTLKRGGGTDEQQSMVAGNFESLSEMVQNDGIRGGDPTPQQPYRGSKKFLLKLAKWVTSVGDPPSSNPIGLITMKPGESLIFTPSLNTNTSFKNDSDNGSDTAVFDWENRLTSKGIKMSPGFTPNLGFEINTVTSSNRSASPDNAWWFLVLSDPTRPRGGVTWDIPRTGAHAVDQYFVEYQVQQPLWSISGSITRAMTFQVSATIQPRQNSPSPGPNYANLKFDYATTSTTSADAQLKPVFGNRIYRYPPVGYLTGMDTFVSASAKINNQGNVKPFALFSATARTTNGGVYENNSRTKDGMETAQKNLLRDGRLAGKPFLFHNPSRGIVRTNLVAEKPGTQPYELYFQPFKSRPDYDNYMVVDGARIPGLTGNTTARGIKCGSYLEIPTGPMQTIADFRRSNVLTSSYAPQFVQPVGNSLLHPLMSSTNVIQSDSAISASPLLDHSFLANHAFYDRFYFSTFATRGVNVLPETVFQQFMAGEAPLASQAFQPYLPLGKSAISAKAELFSAGKPNATAYKQAAEYQMVRGPFNVNSVSVQAWKAVLASTNKNTVMTLWAKSGGLEKRSSPAVPILGMSLPNGGRIDGSVDGGNIDDKKTNDWNGYSELNDGQLTMLATKIVDQVRLRGPFLSMSEFVNRQIGSQSELSLTGALEKAIIDSEINKSFLGYKVPGGFVTEIEPPDLADLSLYKYNTPAATLGNPAAGAPGWLSQGDLLRVLEPAATVRSDTFVIRVCGQAQDAGGKVTARAYAEAVIQRTPEYVDPVNRPSLTAYEIKIPPAATVASTASITNQNFGRRMNVVSFRWLSSNEI